LTTMSKTLKLLTITHFDDHEIRGYLEREHLYADFQLIKGELPKYLNKYPKMGAPDEYGQTLRFRDYGHFVGVCSKFMPYTSFLEKPIEIESLDFDVLLKICEQYPWFKCNE
jgi:hypothetical protein